MKKLLLIVLFVSCFKSISIAQCTIVSSCGYSVTIGVQPKSIIPSATVCPSGYNYNVRFTYTINIRGVNTCNNNNVGIQPQILCGSQNNGYYTISSPAPTVGSASINATYSGTLTTTTNPFRSITDCAIATPSLLACNNLQVTVFGPGLPTTTYTCGISTLPIELVSFESKCENNDLYLNWNTASEHNNDYFTIEKSNDALEWTEITKIKGAGNSSKPKQYTYKTEKGKKAAKYYRLKQTDYNLDFEYSNIISPVNCSETSGELEMYPNPADNIISFGQATPLKKLQIYNSIGQLVYSSDNIPQQLSTSNFENGFYLVTYLNGAETVAKKIIIAH